VDAEPLVVRLLWLGERGGEAANLCDEVAQRVRVQLLDLGCVVVSERADSRELFVVWCSVV